MLETGTMTLGVNYWASHAATEMWSHWDEAVVDSDFKVMSEYGIQIVRCFPLWPDFQPIKLMRRAGPAGGAPMDIRMGECPLPDTPAGQAGMSETMMERFEAFCRIAQKYNIQLIVCLLTGHMTSRQFVPPALESLDVFTHPLALKWEVKFVKYFVSRMKSAPAIVAWESGNESNFMSEASSAAAAWAWSTLIYDAIRCSDTSRPIIGVSNLVLEESKDNKWLITDQAELSDILSVHPYALWNPAHGREEFNTIRNLHHAASECRLVADVGNKPCFVEESGTWRPMVGSYETMAASIRNILWNLYQEDCRGLLWWCAFDQTHIDVAPYDWTFMGLEHGIFSAERQAHPTAAAMRDFRRFIAGLPFDRLPLHRHDAVCIVDNMEVSYASFVLARQAGINLEFQYSAQPLKNADFYFLPSAFKRAGFSTGQWHQLLAKVQTGATLYIGLNDTILDGLEQVTGCGVVGRKLTGDMGDYNFGDFKLVLPRVCRYEMKSYGAKVLATEADGNPVFFEHQYGNGKVYTLAFPLERNVIDHTDTFKTDAWKIYRRMLPTSHIVEFDNPQVLITEHYFDEHKAAVIMVNNQPDAVSGELAIAPQWKVRETLSDLPQAEVCDGQLRLPGNAGILLILSR